MLATLFLTTVFVILYAAVVLMRWGKKLELRGTHCLITGGSTGIGFALAEELVKRSASVTLVARTKSKLVESQAKLLKLVEQLGTRSRVEILVADVTNYPQVSTSGAPWVITVSAPSPPLQFGPPDRSSSLSLRKPTRGRLVL
jgi:3-dehydrosphinganine reductase